MLMRIIFISDTAAAAAAAVVNGTIYVRNVTALYGTGQM